MKDFLESIKCIWNDIKSLIHALFVISVVSLAVSIAFILVSDWRNNAELEIVYGGIKNTRFEAFENDLIVAQPIKQYLDYESLLQKTHKALLLYSGDGATLENLRATRTPEVWKDKSDKGFGRLISSQLESWRWSGWYKVLFGISSFFQLMIIVLSYRLGQLEYRRRKSRKNKIQQRKTKNYDTN